MVSFSFSFCQFTNNNKKKSFSYVLHGTQNPEPEHAGVIDKDGIRKILKTMSNTYLAFLFFNLVQFSRIV